MSSRSVADGEAAAVLRHELVATSPEGRMRLLWPAVVRRMHDALLEELLDRA